MTANQISYQIGNKNADETERHNKEMEIIQSKLADLEESKLQFQNDWKLRDQDIQSRYNDAYLAYLNSAQEWKSTYESQMAEIQQEKLDLEAYYKGIYADYDKEKLALQSQLQEETKRANLASEQLKDTQNWLTSKQMEYNNTAVLLQSSQQELKLAQDLLIARERNEVEMAKLLAQQQAKNVEVKQHQEQIEQGWLQTGVDAVKGVVSTMLTFFGLRGARR